MDDPRFRFLFCVPTTQLSGGVKVIFTLADLLVNAGHHVDVFSWRGIPEWYKLSASLLAVKDLAEVDMSKYDFVLVSNAMMLPMVLPNIKSAKCIFFAQDYEAFHHSNLPVYESFMAVSPVFDKLYSLPVPIIATSEPIRECIRERTGRESYHVPVGLDRTVFKPQPRVTAGERKRILLVGNYMMPYKGMADARDAVEMLSREIPVELVVITQEERGRYFFNDCSYPVTVHFSPTNTDVPPIIASCDVYCCSSWYEGLGLPALEAFACGTPVVSTMTIGVFDYARDRDNLLLAEPNNPQSIYVRLKEVLSDEQLRSQLVAGGYATIARGYDWETSERMFLDAIRNIDAEYHGAGTIDVNEMQELLSEMERSGAYTPIEAYREFGSIESKLDDTCETILAGGFELQTLDYLRDLRRRLQPYLSNEHAQYFAAFKAKFDFCQLLILLGENGEGRHARTLIERRRSTTTASNAASLTEIRYPQP